MTSPPPVLQAQTESTTIQTESSETKAQAAALRENAAQLNVEVADTLGNVEVYERKVCVVAGGWTGGRESV